MDEFGRDRIEAVAQLVFLGTTSSKQSLQTPLSDRPVARVLQLKSYTLHLAWLMKMML
jgi:hypothetical protein